ncbi:hypothetical protein TH468_11520 [Thalassospira sp. MCCC 1A03138]|nr:hypothetical protein TH468_11520 [Thalassospira sp. MCCC 1A03138]
MLISLSNKLPIANDFEYYYRDGSGNRNTVCEIANDVCENADIAFDGIFRLGRAPIWRLIGSMRRNVYGVM